MVVYKLKYVAILNLRRVLQSFLLYRDLGDAMTRKTYRCVTYNGDISLPGRAEDVVNCEARCRAYVAYSDARPSSVQHR